MKKQTAVDWLLDQLLKDGYIERLPVLQFQQAKEMEKQQIIDAIDSFYDYKNWSDELPTKGKQYYNETFKNK
jgi:hypothetical protein